MDNTLTQFRAEVNATLLLCREAQTAMNICNALSELSDNSECNDIIDFLIYSELFHALGATAKLYDKDKNSVGMPKLLNKYQSLKAIAQHYAGDTNIEISAMLIEDFMTSLDDEDNHPLTQVKTIRDKIWAHNDKKYMDSEAKRDFWERVGTFENSILLALYLADFFLNAFYCYDNGNKFEIEDEHYKEQLNTMISRLHKDKKVLTQ